MAKKCNLIIDSPAELSKEFCEKHDVKVLSFSYSEPDVKNGGLQGIDDMFSTLSAHEFYEAMRAGAAPMTSQPSQLTFETAFEEAIDSGIPTVYLAFDSAISGAYEGAMIAFERLQQTHTEPLNLYIVDTKLPSTPLNLLAHDAVMKCEEGMEAADLAAWAAEAHNYIYTYFMVDDLDSLARGGRLHKGVARVGTALKLKPMLTVCLDGSLDVTGIARGRKKGIRMLAENYLEHRASPEAVAAIGNADCPQDAQELKELILEESPSATFLESNIGPTIGSHVGPSMLSCCFWGSDKRAAKVK